MGYENISDKTVILTVIFHRPSMKRQGDQSAIKSEAEEGSLHLTKDIIQSPEFQKITTKVHMTMKWLKRHAFNSRLGLGVYLLPIKLVDLVHEKMKEVVQEYEALRDAFCETYLERVESAKKRLAEQFNEKDYPSLAAIKNSISVSWRLMVFQTPTAELIGEAAFAEEKAKAEQTWKEATQDCVAALRVAASGVLKKLTASLGEKSNGQKKSLREDSYEDIKEFFDLFNARNIANDVQLKKVVDSGRKLLESGKKGKWLVISDLRDDSIRDTLRPQLEEVEKQVDKLVSAVARRRISFDD